MYSACVCIGGLIKQKLTISLFFSVKVSFLVVISCGQRENINKESKNAKRLINNKNMTRN